MRDAHLRAAEQLVEEGGSAERVLEHLLAAAPAGEAWVVELLLLGAGRAIDAGELERAAAYLRRAQAEPPPPFRRAEVEHLLELATR